jgi:hypothetical protein
MHPYNSNKHHIKITIIYNSPDYNDHFLNSGKTKPYLQFNKDQKLPLHIKQLNARDSGSQEFQKHICTFLMRLKKSGLVFHLVHTVMKSFEGCSTPLYGSSTRENLKFLLLSKSIWNYEQIVKQKTQIKYLVVWRVASFRQDTRVT